MNVDSFKQQLITQTGRKGFAWREYEDYKGEGSNIYTFISLPNFPRCMLDVYIGAKTLEVIVQLDTVSNSADTLKLMNDFNAHCPFLKAYTAEVKEKTVLFIASNVISVRDEEGGVASFFAIIDSLFSDPVQSYLRPLTILAK